ncbi:class I SAM-dependent DNA methyltransferase [Nocardioides sp. HB32]
MPTTSNSKRLSLNEIRDRVAKFVVDYADVKNEKQHTGDFWKALMRCYGIEDSYLHGVIFEYQARRASTAGIGYIDVFKPGQFLIEQKSDGKITRPVPGGMSNAEMQARDYLLGGDITRQMEPRWVVTSDFATIQVSDLSKKREDPTRTITIATRDLIDHVETFLFLADEDPGDLIAADQAEASIQAAKLMGTLYSALTGDADVDNDIENAEEEDDETMEASIVLTRLLFLLFGDDANLWERGLFHKFIKTRTLADGSDLGPMLAALFDVLNTPENKRDKRVDEDMAAFPYVNGDLYAGPTKMQYFDSSMRDALLECCDFDWSRISPAVFGSLFQTVKSKEARHAAGEHYTSEENILKTLRPLFLDEFRARLDNTHTEPKLREFHTALKTYRYVDAACGCGNFLIVAYRELRQLELDLLVKLRIKKGEDLDPMLNPADVLNVTLDQFYGIELNWWPAKIAETAMFLVDHQANQQMAKTLGLFPKRLPIDIKANIHHGNALTTDWDTVLPTAGPTTYVFGNPPFLGHYTRNAEQGKELEAAWGTSRVGHLDFVTAWHAKALGYLANKAGEFAFVTTNSITQGEPVPELFPRIHEKGWRIKFAHRTFKWNSESASRDKAAVHCVIIGFTRTPATRTDKGRLFDYPQLTGAPVERKVTTGINGYLVDAPTVYVTSRSKPLSADLPVVAFGSMANDGGGLLISPDEHAAVVADPVAAKYVRKFVGARELINNLDRWCLWLVDLDPADVANSPVLKERIGSVREKRAASNRATTKELAQTPHLFGELRQPTVPYLCIPRHFAEDRLYATVARFGPEVIAGDANFTCPDPDGFGFAIISSAMFITWQKTVGGRLKSDPRFAGTTTWNTLPLPAVKAALRKEIIAAGKGVLDARAKHPERSLAAHYNPLAMDPDLLKAHRALDRVVDRAFGSTKRQPAEADRQQVLFERYAEMTA